MTAPVAPRRVTVVAPQTRVDISLPPQSTVAELIPHLARMAAPGDHVNGGWTLGRLGTDALDDSSTVASAGIRDGEILYLNPRGLQPAPLLFDDVVDAIAKATSDRRGTWRPGLTRGIGLSATFAALTALAVLIVMAGPPAPFGSLAAGALAAFLLLGGGVLSRAARDGTAGAVVAGAGVPAALLGGIAAIGTWTPGKPWSVGANAFAVGCSVTVVFTILAAIVVGARIAVFAALAAAGTIGAVGALVALGTGARGSSVAAGLVAAGMLISPVLPMLALRLARLPLPHVPTDPENFRRDERPTPGPEVSRSAEVAAQVLTGLLAALGAVVFGGTLALLGSGSMWARALGTAAGLALLLRSQAYLSAWQRGALMLGGAGVLAVTAASVAASGGEGTRVVMVGVVALAGLIALTYALRASRQQPSPYWTRLLDIIEFFSLVSLLPLAAAVIGIFAGVRSLGG
ncbi:MAG: type VII secretion integral membrane protein EccD [Micromonosporaceae bacterium]|nr:type VII secretion integral membrane protein EccD [Micromonosporaceae bacterium]